MTEHDDRRGVDDTEDAALVARVRLHDDRLAFAQLVRRHQGMVRAQLRRLLHGDDAAADDLAQEVFLQAWRKLDQFRGDARFATWLHRIAFRTFLQHSRRASPLQTVSSNEDNDVSAEAGETATDAIAGANAWLGASGLDFRLDLERALRRLSTAEQVVLQHCVQLGLSHDEAAYVLSMPLGTVKTHALRGKAKLRQWLSAWQSPGEQERTG
jgi:RNA polymerase sigma factor (sigma-70 family)